MLAVSTTRLSKRRFTKIDAAIKITPKISIADSDAYNPARNKNARKKRLAAIPPNTESALIAIPDLPMFESRYSLRIFSSSIAGVLLTEFFSS